MADFAESAWRRINGLEPFPEPAVIRLRHPVVLMHGFGLFASFRRGGHLHHEAMSLRSRGVVAYAPNVSAYSTVKSRAGLWLERLRHILDESGADKLNLIAQSMGGLDARYLITCMGMHDAVASLTSVATPHHGSGVANIVLERPERMKRWTAEVLDWMGTASLADASSDFLTAVSELTPDFVTREFNPAVPDHPAVRYFSYAARAGKGTDVPINPILRLLNYPMYEREGENDGFVGVESAKWGEFVEVIDADHAQQVGLSFPGGSAFNSHDFYAAIVRKLGEAGY